jgi:hypothetical protein
LIRGVPGTVWLVVLLFVLVAACQTVVFPNFRAPDEARQVDLIVMVDRGEAWPWPAPGTRYLSSGVSAGGFTPSDRLRARWHLADKLIPARGDRPSYQDRGGTTPARPQRRSGRNQLVQHPPLYYVAAAAALGVVPDWEHTDFDRVFLLLRWLNVLLMAPLPLLLYATARRLRLPDPVRLAAALTPIAIPELTHLAASVNNDNLLTVLAAVLTLLIVHVLTGDLSRRTAAWIGVIGTLALLTKGFALFIPPWLVLTYVVAAVRYRRPAALASLGISLVLIGPGLAWWVRNKIIYGRLQPPGLGEQLLQQPQQFGWSDGGAPWLTRLAERLVTLFFVHDQTGLRTHNGPWWVARVALLLVVVGIAGTVALRVLPRVDSLLLGLSVLILVAIIVKGSWEHFTLTHIDAGMQGRYLYAGLAGVMVVAVASAARLPDRLRRMLPLALLGLTGVAHTVYVVNTLDLFWTPAGTTVGDRGLRPSIAAMLYWYPMPHGVVVAIAAATAATAIGVAVALAAQVGRPPPTACAGEGPPSTPDG